MYIFRQWCSGDRIECFKKVKRNAGVKSKDKFYRMCISLIQQILPAVSSFIATVRCFSLELVCHMYVSTFILFSTKPYMLIFNKLVCIKSMYNNVCISL